MEFLFYAEPNFKEMAARGLPSNFEPVFPSTAISTIQSTILDPNFDPVGTLPPLLPARVPVPSNDHKPRDFTSCSKNFLANNHDSIDLSKTFVLPCPHATPTLRQLLSDYRCVCGNIYFYSFCSNGVFTSTTCWHCPQCNKCVSGQRCATCNRQADASDCSVQ